MATATSRRGRRPLAATAALLCLALHAGPPQAAAEPPQPPPGCGFVSAVWWSPCHVPPPVPGQGWTPIDGIPGTFGPHGYTPKTSGG